MSVAVGAWASGVRAPTLFFKSFDLCRFWMLRHARHMLRPGTKRLRLTIVGLLVALTALMIALVSSGHESAVQRKHAETWYVHTLKVLLVSGELNTSVHSALRGQRGYLLTHDPRFLAPYHRSVASTPMLLQRLRALTQDNLSQQRSLAALDLQVREYFAHLDRTLVLARSGRQDEAMRMVRLGEGKHRIDAILGAVAKIDAEEERLLQERRIAFEQAARRDERYEHALVVLGFLLLAVAFIAGVLAVRAHARAMAATAQLRLMATMDELTGLPNRRHFLGCLEAEAARARRSATRLCLAVIDVDHFKRINDNHGHPAGDHVLRTVAEVLRAGTRVGDLLGRLGGEEFALLMPDTSVVEAGIVCDRLRETLATRLVILPSGGSSSATMSTGIAMMELQEGTEALISRADTALYKAKQAGRNRVQLAA